MIRFVITGSLLLALAGCALFEKRPVVIAPQPGPAAAKAVALEDKAASRAAASVQAAGVANASNPVGVPQEATAGELKVAASNLPSPAPEDASAALERVNKALRGDLEAARKDWEGAQSEAAQLQARLSAAETEAERERLAGAARLESIKADYEARIEKAMDEGDRQQQRLLNWIFVGGGGLLILAGVGCFTFLSGLPYVGPRIGLMLIAAGAATIAIGQAVRWVLDHPWVIWAGIAVPLAAAAAFLVANRWHDYAEKLKTAGHSTT